MPTTGTTDEVGNFFIPVDHAGNPQVKATTSLATVASSTVGFGFLVPSTAAGALAIQGRMQIAIILGISQPAP